MTRPAPAPAPRRRTIRKAASLIILLLWGVAGATLNVAVAWGCVLFNNVSTSPLVQIFRADRPERSFVAAVFDEWGTTAVAARLSYGEMGSVSYAMSERNRLWEFRDARGVERLQWPECVSTEVHSWEHKLSSSGGDGKRYQVEYATFLARGMPMRSMWTALELDDATGNWILMRTSSAFAISKPNFLHPLAVDAAHVLPCRIWWPGFAINTLFYAGVLWMLFCGPFALRRMIRRRRGRCAQCAYPIGQSPVCTECGAAVPVVQ